MSTVYQLIEHEYNSDDGHYDRTPVDDVVYDYEPQVRVERNRLNVESVRQNNAQVMQEVARRRAVWEANGKIEPPPVNSRGTQHYDVYSTKGIKYYEEKYLFTGDPTDLDAIERFAGRFTNLTYYTYDTLRVV